MKTTVHVVSVDSKYGSEAHAFGSREALQAFLQAQAEEFPDLDMSIDVFTEEIDIPLPASVHAALTALESDFDRIHTFEDDDEQSESAYRKHDEHNFDVREDIERSAAALAWALRDDN